MPFLPPTWHAGFFQNLEGQFGCISCDSLGDYYVEDTAATVCQNCPSNTQRYSFGEDQSTGAVLAANRTSCMCKKGKSSYSISFIIYHYFHYDLLLFPARPTIRPYAPSAPCGCSAALVLQSQQRLEVRYLCQAICTLLLQAFSAMMTCLARCAFPVPRAGCAR